MKPYLLPALALLPYLTHAQAPTTTAPAPDSYRAAVGVLGSYRTAGLLGEVRATRRLGLKLAAVRQSDGTVAGEYSAAGIGQLTYFLPSRLPWLEPTVGLGGIYSAYHWQQRGGHGTLQDLNVGGSFGANVRFHRRLRTGLLVFGANGFRAGYDEAAGTMRKTGRRLLVLPALTLEVLL
ncbi:hypothetical protein EJV47_15085 [Hymenobacter gummosus]|uniref:DUF3575 domain-containing protein n=1 Tax=Hymenobacter gummosus TaxID=1776032 RepID=A0A431U1G5_9BACT|nr:hypothetical protein [Hymenobacter gummosus]RTQ48917.1 hypothetical protein EJV47_15085 [Hymenobacter gummosus]